MIRRLAIAVAAAALGACTGALAPTAELQATLTGHQQAPPPGDLDGTGTALIRAAAGSGRICWELAVRGIDSATGAAIRRAPAGSVGPVVLALAVPDAAGRSAGCSDGAPALAAEMAAQPHLFYVDVASVAFPAGAIRGQLRGDARLRAPRPPVRR